MGPQTKKPKCRIRTSAGGARDMVNEELQAVRPDRLFRSAGALGVMLTEAGVTVEEAGQTDLVAALHRARSAMDELRWAIQKQVDS